MKIYVFSGKRNSVVWYLRFNSSLISRNTTGFSFLLYKMKSKNSKANWFGEIENLAFDRYIQTGSDESFEILYPCILRICGKIVSDNPPPPDMHITKEDLIFSLVTDIIPKLPLYKPEKQASRSSYIYLLLKWRLGVLYNPLQKTMKYVHTFESLDRLNQEQEENGEHYMDLVTFNCWHDNQLETLFPEEAKTFLAELRKWWLQNNSSIVQEHTKSKIDKLLLHCEEVVSGKSSMFAEPGKKLPKRQTYGYYFLKHFRLPHHVTIKLRIIHRQLLEYFKQFGTLENATIKPYENTTS